MMQIKKDITIEELLENVPQAVRFLMINGIKCIACGEPIWGTLEEAAKEKGFTDEEIEKFVNDLQKFADDPSKDVEPPAARVNPRQMNKGQNH